MRILQIINNLGGGGAEKIVCEMSIRLVEKGHSVDVLLLNNNNDKYSHLLKKSNISVVSINKSKYNIFSFKIIRSFIASGGYDVVHSHLFPTQYFVVLATLSLSNLPILITTEHSTFNRRQTKPYLKLLEKWMYSRYNHIACISESTKDSLINFIGFNSSITVVNNGVSINSFFKAIPSNDNLFKSNIKYLIMVARFDQAKDQKTVISSMRFIDKNVSLILVGDGPLRKECENYAKMLNLSDRIFFLGFRQDVPQLLKASDIVVLSSHWEGFGLSAVEGMAAGKPVVVSNVSGLRDVVSSSGIVFEKGNYMQLSSVINNLVSDNEYYDFLVEKSLSRAKEFEVNTMVDRYVELYK